MTAKKQALKYPKEEYHLQFLTIMTQVPVLRKFVFKLENGNVQQEFVIKEKDYGEIVLYDVFFKDIFVCAISQDGKVLVCHRDYAISEPVDFDEEIAGSHKYFCCK